MLYDYKSEELVQDVVLEDIELLVDDITEEFYSLRRYNELDIYVPSPIAREIIAMLLDEVDELWVHADSHNDLLYRDNKEILITIANDGMVFVEEARIDGVLKSCEDSSLAYVYDGFGKKDIDVLEGSAESILVFGFEEDDMDECNSLCSDHNSETVHVERDENGLPIAFSTSWYGKNENSYYYSSYYHYSNNLDDLKSAADIFNISL